MSWGIFKIGDWINRFQTPKWLKDLLQEVQNIIVASAFQIAEQYIARIENKIIEVSTKPMTNSEKFLVVFRYAKELGIATPDSILNIILNSLVLRLKNRGDIQ